MQTPLLRLGPVPLQQRPRPAAPPASPPHHHDDDVSSWHVGRALLLGGAALLGAAVPATAQVKVQDTPRAGSLVLSDFFERDTHGETVARSAEQLGFTGQIVRREAPTNPLIQWNKKLDAYLDQKQFTPEQMRDFLTRYTLSCQVGTLQSATEDLRAVLEQGMHHSAFNLSRGCGPAQVADALYARVRPALHGGTDAEAVKAAQRFKKIASAFPQSDLATFQQNLLNLTQQSSPELEKNQQAYDAAVAALEAKHVSVLVAAANSGEVLAKMQADNGGVPLQVGPTFWNNRLANAQVTTVGGSEGAYTNPDPGIDLFADGNAYESGNLVNYGTSFATPRVGAVMAHLHQQNPDWSSAEVEGYIQQNLSARPSHMDSQKATRLLEKSSR